MKKLLTLIILLVVVISLFSYEEIVPKERYDIKTWDVNISMKEYKASSYRIKKDTLYFITYPEGQKRQTSGQFSIERIDQ